MLHEKVKNTLVYMHSLVDFNELPMVAIVMDENGITYSAGANDDIEIEDIDKMHNPLAHVIDKHIEDMCESCISDPTNMENPFFQSIVRSYLHYLHFEFGEGVPVSRAIAFFVDHEKDVPFNLDCYDSEGNYLEEYNFEDETLKFYLFPHGV